MSIMKQIYRRSGVLPAGSFEEIARDYRKNGEWGEVTTGHAGNALVVIMKPADGLYSVCVGPAARGLSAPAPYPHSGPIYRETNAFWEIRLADSPAGVMKSAAGRARERLREAEELARGCEHSREGFGDGSWQKTMYNLLDHAQGESQRGLQFQAEAAGLSGNEALYYLSRATRRFNHVQVLAAQAIQMVLPPARLRMVPENE